MDESTTAPNQGINPERLQKVPWLAMASLLIVLICISTSAIIVASNKHTVASWSTQPAVLLAIFSSISNFALGTAFSIAVVVVWWLSAVAGAPLSQLHYIWDRGEGFSFFSAFAAGGKARKVVLATFFMATVKFVNNPLLQRATEIVLRDLPAESRPKSS